ncbi:BTB/POZ domain-containing protein [Orchesella cincta]|uniref:BTB/POZ domain-containing protein n=1 Tax=Orchesella cincta TaxID=48709 RepID=A0A1D2MAK3_ORCCI|nr:BTB/POZ domain-containing protein [Orchesella cincta]
MYKYLLTTESPIRLRWDRNGEYETDGNGGVFQKLHCDYKVPVNSTEALEAFRPFKEKEESDDEAASELGSPTYTDYHRPVHVDMYVKTKCRDGEVKGGVVNVELFGQALNELVDLFRFKKILKLKVVGTLVAEDDPNDKIDIDTKKGIVIYSSSAVAEILPSYCADMDNPRKKYSFMYIVAVPPNLLIKEGRMFVGKITLQVIATEAILFGVDVPPRRVRDKRVLTEKIFTDFAIVPKRGNPVECHRVFIASVCPAFKRIVSENGRSNSCKLEISEEGVHALLQYIYYSGLDDALKSSEIALELLETGHKYDIPGLENTMKRIFKKPKEWCSVDVAIHLSVWAHLREADGSYKDVMKKVAQVLKAKQEDFKRSALFTELFVRYPNAFRDLLLMS